MKNKTSNKILSLVLALMVFTLLSGGFIAPVTASAASAPANIVYVGTVTQWSGKDSSNVYTNPQAAIDAAALTGTTTVPAYVLVAVGEYTTAVNSNAPFSLANNVTVIGGFKGTEDGIVPTYTQNGNISNTTENTVFSGGGSTRVFDHNKNGLTSAAVLENTVIANGKATIGGGMYNNSSSPTLANCTFTNNTASTHYGGGMLNYESSPTLINCTFTENVATTIGGGMYNDGGSHTTLINCAFTTNTAGFAGGGMVNSNSSSPTLTNCSFTNNKATGGYGGGMYNDNHSSPTLTNCTFTENTAFSYGGGMYNNGSCSPALTNCTFTENSANTGGGIYNDKGGYQGGSNPTLINCIVSLNTGGDVVDIGSTPVYKSSVKGNLYYVDNTNTSSVSPAAVDFETDGSLKSTAVYAIKKGDYDLYVAAIDNLNSKLNAAGLGVGSTLSAQDMRDINGNLVVSGTPGSSTIDIGAFRFIDSGEDGAQYNQLNPPAPIVIADSSGANYASGALTNSDVTITVSKGNITQWIKESADSLLFPQTYMDDYYKNALLYYKLGSGNETQYTMPLTVSTSGIYILYSKLSGNESAPVTFETNIDKVKPTVSSVSPSGNNVAIGTSAMAVTFSEEMNTGLSIGTVSLSSGASVSTGVWQGDKKTIDYTLSGLTDNKEYTVSISGFKDAAGNVMNTDSTRTFSTPEKTVSVGTQSGMLEAGTAGTVTFAVTTANIANGSAITLNNLNSVAGISLVTTNTAGNSTTITISITGATPQGTHPLTLTIDGITSAGFNLSVDAPVASTTYTITFDANRGSVYPASMQTGADGRLTSLPTPAISGNYTFDGWYTAAGIQISTSYVFTSDTTAYAHWTYTGGDSGSSRGSYIPQTPAYKKVPIKDLSGRTIGSFDTSSSVSGGVMSIKPGNQSGYTFSFNLLCLKELESGNKGGKFRITLPGMEYDLPFNMANIITGLADFLGDASLQDYSLDFAIKKLTGDDLTKAQEDFKKAYPSGEVSGDLYDISFTLYNNGNKVDFDANQFDSAITFALTTKIKCNAVFKYDTASGRFSFVPAKFGDTKATAQTKTHSVYAAARNSVTFHDVKAGTWYEPFVTRAANMGLVEGYTGLFRPDADLTRAEFVQMIVNAIQLPAVKADTNEYGDVANKNAWYYSAVMSAKSSGLLDGFTNVDFKPNQSITREEMASVLAAVLQRSNVPATRQTIYLDQIYVDYAYMDKKYLAGIELVHRVKLMQGVGGGKFDPKGVTTKAQAATVQMRLLEVLGMIDSGIQ